MSPAGRDACTLLDVASHAGVSEATASRVLAGSRPVGDALRSRVLASASALAYTPNPHARALARSRDASIALVVHDVTDPYFSEVARGALEAAREAGRTVVISDTGRDLGRELEVVRRARAQRVEALVLAGSGSADRDARARLGAELLAFERSGGRAALVGRHLVAGDCVRPDNVLAGRLLGDHLVALGHRVVGVVAGPGGLTASDDRFAGLLSALTSGAAPAQVHVRAGDFTRDGGEAAAGELVALAPGLTAIVALNDQMAIGALAALRRRGRRVPDDVALCGIDDVPVARDLVPALTTVRVPMVELGRRAVELVLDEKVHTRRDECLCVELVVRQSTAGVGTAGVGTAGVGTAGVGTAGVGTAGVGTVKAAR
ncbi:MAG: LacI family DNA-binding transcriptional regulator [Acidimicrobiales bacterium]